MTQEAGSESEAGPISENFSHPSDVLLGSTIQFYIQSTIQTQNSPASLPQQVLSHDTLRNMTKTPQGIQINHPDFLMI